MTTVYELDQAATPRPWVLVPYSNSRKTNEYVGRISSVTGTDVYSGPFAFGALRGTSGEEADANAALLTHCSNHFMAALGELRRLADNQAGFTAEQLEDHAMVDLSLLAELERVNEST